MVKWWSSIGLNWVKCRTREVLHVVERYYIISHTFYLVVFKVIFFLLSSLTYCFLERRFLKALHLIMLWFFFNQNFPTYILSQSSQKLLIEIFKYILDIGCDRIFHNATLPTFMILCRSNFLLHNLGDSPHKSYKKLQKLQKFILKFRSSAYKKDWNLTLWTMGKWRIGIKLEMGYCRGKQIEIFGTRMWW